MTLYDESAGIPMIIVGPGVPEGETVSTPASLVDIGPTVLSAFDLAAGGAGFPGLRLQDLAAGRHAGRAVLSEYHDGGAPTGMFMLRTPRWKYNAYPGYAPELYDMENDPSELVDLAADPAVAYVLEECERRLRSLVDPERESRRAFDDQAALIERLGGVEVLLRTDEFDFTPIPGSRG